MASLPSFARRTWCWPATVSAVAVLMATAGLVVLPPHSPADAFAPPIVDIPKCYPRSFGSVIDCPTDLRNNGWGEAGTTRVVGTASPGATYRVEFSPRVPPCQWSNESGCYTRIEQYAPGNVYYLRYGASLSDQRLATNMTGSMSSEDAASWSPGYGVCKADWNGVYADGGDFAERAEAVRDCSLEFRYSRSDDTPVPLDRLLGPTWVRISSSITVCDAANAGGCTQSHGEGATTLVRIDGDMWESPVATCETVSQSGPGGSEIRFDGDSSVNTQLDSVKSWAFRPANVTVRSSDGYYRHDNTAYVSAAPPGTLRATYLLRSWQGSSEATCTATVQPYTPPDTCGLMGKPKLKGAARVGKTLKVKAPGWQVSDAEISYRWKVGGTKTGKDSRRLKLTGKMRGKRVAVTVTATAPSCERHRATLRAGKVRSSR
ncbi:MAG: hypothetical protein WBP61_00095 [Nocardioides sp.]